MLTATSQRLVCLCILLGLGRSAGVRAERLSIVAYRLNDQPVASETVVALLSSSVAADGVEVFDAFDAARRRVFEGMVTARDRQVLERGRQRMTAGWRGYLEARVSLAAAQLAEGRQAVVSIAHVPQALPLLAEISLRLGAVKLELGLSAEAADEFRFARAIAPDQEVTEVQFKPEVVNAYEASLRDVRPRAEVFIGVVPDTAALVVDGRAQTSGTLALEDGLHIVSAQAPGYAPTSRLVTVSAGTTATFDLPLEVDPVVQRVLLGARAIQPGTPEEEARRVLSAVLQFSGGDGVLLVASVWRRGKPALLGQLCTQNLIRCSGIAEIGYPTGGERAAADELWRRVHSTPRFPPTLQNDARLVQSESAPLPIHPKADPEPLWKNHWLWVAVAAGVGATAGAAYMLRGEQVLPVFKGELCDFGACP